MNFLLMSSSMRLVERLALPQIKALTCGGRPSALMLRTNIKSSYHYSLLCLSRTQRCQIIPWPSTLAWPFRAYFNKLTKQNYARRTRIPSPLTTVRSPTLEYAILRPLVANLQHRVVVDELRSEVNRSMLEPVRRAGLDIDWQTDSDEAEESKHEGATDDFISSNKPSRSLFRLVLPTRRKVKITVTSHLGSPIYGTQYEVSGLECRFASIKQATHHKLGTALSGLSRLSILDLCAFIEDIPSKASDTNKGRWKSTRPHIGELVLPSAKSGKPIATMRVNLADGRLVLKIAPARPEYTKGKKVLAWAWSHGRLSNAPVTTGQSDDIGIEEKVADKLDFREVVEKSLALSK